MVTDAALTGCLSNVVLSDNDGDQITADPSNCVVIPLSNIISLGAATESTLEVLYKNKNISEVLDMTVDEAYSFFDSVPTVKRKLKTLVDVGLSYITVGQNATTLSGGEAQRVKLAKELSKRDTGKTIYIFDEPTTGLHFHDINQLLKIIYTNSIWQG